MKKIFLSYSWAKLDEANEIDTILNQFDLKLIRDVRDLKQMANIPAFMDRIKEVDYAVLLISESYIKSKNCLYEVIKLLEDENFTTKAIPIIMADTKISSAVERLKYLKYWESQIEQLQEGVKTGLNSFAFASNIINDLEQFQIIRTNLDKFFNFLTNHLYFSYEEEYNSDFQKLITHIGVSKENKRTTSTIKPQEIIDSFNFKNNSDINNLFGVYKLLLAISNAPKVDQQLIMGGLQLIANKLSAYFSNNTKSRCAASIKLIRYDQNILSSDVLNLVSDAGSLSRYSEIDKIRVTIYDNTIYSNIFHSMPDENRFFISNNLRRHKYDDDTLLKYYGNDKSTIPDNLMSSIRNGKWALPYLSVMSVPVFNRLNKNQIIGFLNIDSDKKNAFKSKEDLKIVQDIGEELFFILNKLPHLFEH